MCVSVVDIFRCYITYGSYILHYKIQFYINKTGRHMKTNYLKYGFC